MKSWYEKYYGKPAPEKKIKIEIPEDDYNGFLRWKNRFNRAALIGWHLSGATMEQMIELSGLTADQIKQVIDEYESKSSAEDNGQRPDTAGPEGL